jgi:hypothetical protein
MISAADFDDALGWSAPRARTALPEAAARPVRTAPAASMSAESLISSPIHPAEVAFPAIAVRRIEVLRTRALDAVTA